MRRPGGGDEPASSPAPGRRHRPEPSPTHRALGLLVRREHSARELAHKLVARGVEAGEAQAVIDKLADAGWQDDARFAETLVRSRAASGYGPAWIRAELGTHGLGAEAVSAAIAGFDGDWNEAARDLVRRRFGEAGPQGPAQRRKAADLLLRRGYGMEQVRSALG